MLAILIIFALFLPSTALFDGSSLDNNSTGCPNRSFIGCILQLKEDHIQFDRNIVRVILGINSEAKLLHTCKSYTNVLPCFRDRVLECGNDQQKEMLIEVGKALMFLCSPFSLMRQRVLLRHQACISKVLSFPISTGCKPTKKVYVERINKCKRHCSATLKNFNCALKTWISEQNACTLSDLAEHCGNDSADFYADLQASVFDPNYPFVCQGENKAPISSSTRNYLATNTPPSSISKTKTPDLFTRTRILTRRPNEMFYISPHTPEHISQSSTPVFLFVTRVTPKIPPQERTTSDNKLRTNETLDGQRISAAQAALISLLKRLLPLALSSNLTSILNQHKEIATLGNSMGFNNLLQTTTPKHSHSIQLNPENNDHLQSVVLTTQATTSPPLTIKSVTPIFSTSITTEVPKLSTIKLLQPTSHRNRQEVGVQKNWRPWYFSPSSEN